MLLGEAKREAQVRTEPHPTRSFALPRRGGLIEAKLLCQPIKSKRIILNDYQWTYETNANLALTKGEVRGK